jgi:hypothetical protein
MGASGWSYFVPYQPDLQAALNALRAQVLADGDYWWAAKYEFGKSAKEYDDRPTSEDQLWGDEAVQEEGTHSILDMRRMLRDGEEPDYGTVQVVTAAEALDRAGTETLTREHVQAIDDLARRRWFGRCAVLHDSDGKPDEIYFWGFSGD